MKTVTLRSFDKHPARGTPAAVERNAVKPGAPPVSCKTTASLEDNASAASAPCAKGTTIGETYNGQ